jgi:hypothetical protein
MAKDELAKIEEQVAGEIKRKRKRRATKQWPQGGKTRIAADVRARKRFPPPVPARPLSEILEMDPLDPEFKHPDGRKPIWEGIPDEELDAFDLMRKKKQQRSTARKARIRKYEAVVMKSHEILSETPEGDEPGAGSMVRKGVYAEDRMIAEGILALDDWDDEELARGYRRNRDGKFGKPPQFIPREVQQEAFRRLIGRGDRKMKGVYLKTVEGLIDLAHNASSEKVRLDAQKELMNRIVGKIPDRTIITQDEPWMDILVDSIVPISDIPPIDLEMADDGVAYMPPFEDLEPSEGGVAALPVGGAATHPQDEAPPPSPRPKTKSKAKSRKSKPRSQ